MELKTRKGGGKALSGSAQQEGSFQKHLNLCSIGTSEENVSNLGVVKTSLNSKVLIKMSYRISEKIQLL